MSTYPGLLAWGEMLFDCRRMSGEGKKKNKLPDSMMVDGCSMSKCQIPSLLASQKEVSIKHLRSRKYLSLTNFVIYDDLV
jgi:hypothetical protein